MSPEKQIDAFVLEYAWRGIASGRFAPEDFLCGPRDCSLAVWRGSEILLLEDLLDCCRATRDPVGEQRLRALVDASPCMLWMAGAERILINPALRRFLGCPQRELLQEAWTELIHPLDRDGVVAEYGRATTAHEPFRIECRVRRQGGEHALIVHRGAPRYSAAGLFLGYVGAMVDVEACHKSASRVA